MDEDREEGSDNAKKAGTNEKDKIEEKAMDRITEDLTNEKTDGEKGMETVYKEKNERKVEEERECRK